MSAQKRKVASVDDDASALEKEHMASVLAGKGKMWTTHLACLLADRGDFAVVETECKRWIAVLPEGEWKWVVDNGRGTAVPKAIDAAVKKLAAELATFSPDSESEEEAEHHARFELSLDVDGQLRNKLLPQLMLKQDKVLEPRKDGVFCSDGKFVMDSGEARSIVSSDYCVQTVGFESTALSSEPEGFAAWYDSWKKQPNSTLVDMVLAAACLLRKPVRGEIGFTNQSMQLLVATVAGDVVLCTTESAAFTVHASPPEGTTPLMLVWAAKNAVESVKLAMDSLCCGSASSNAASLAITDMLKLSSRVPADVHASHVLYSCLRSSQVAKETPLEHVVKLLKVKEMLKPLGVTCANRVSLENILAKTFANPPSVVDANSHRKIPAKGLVLTGVYAVKYIESEPPRTWEPKEMIERNESIAALLDSEEDDVE